MKRCKRRSSICVEPGGLARSGCATNCSGCMACDFPRRRFTKCSCSTDSVFCRHANAHVTSRNATAGRCQAIACRWIRARSDPVTETPKRPTSANTASGDTVNVASRLLEVAKQQHCRVVVSEDLFAAACSTLGSANLEAEPYARLTVPIRCRTGSMRVVRILKAEIGDAAGLDFASNWFTSARRDRKRGDN
jgi:hypothetical protein